MKKHDRNVIPNNLKAEDFIYMGRPAKDQGDFGVDVGLSDMACVNQFGEGNTNKFYHCGVVKTLQNNWFMYCEWGRIYAGKSWTHNSCNSQDFQFTECISEQEARTVFAKQCNDKNLKRLIQKTINDKSIWVSKSDKDGYVVLDLAVREKGLPDAYKIKDSTGLLKTESKKEKKTPKIKSTYSPYILSLVNDLIGGTKNYTRAISQSTGVYPTKSTIDKVRNDLIPMAMTRLSSVGNKLEDQLKDQELIDISTLIATMVPRPIPLGGNKTTRQSSIILSSDNVLSLQSDLDVFESSLQNEDFDEKEEQSDTNPHEVLLGGKDCEIAYIDNSTKLHKWISETLSKMTNHNHSYIRGNIKLKNIFEVRRPDRDSKFIEYTKNIFEKHKNKKILHKARLQPKERIDVSDISDFYENANVFLGIHGTRSVNVAPILQSHLRLPKNLSGVVITGAAFGTGVYSAVDYKKSIGYSSYKDSYWSKGSGGIEKRGFFMFLCDVVMGDPYMARSTNSWDKPPDSKDSIAAFSEFCSVQNDEHIVFDPNAMRIRYLLECEI